MIALRGTIKRTPQPENEAKTSPSKNINDHGSSEWIWTGYWAFDSLPAPEFLENRKSKRPPHGVRPFVYKFHHVEDAKDVIVPSTTLGDDQDQEVDDREKEKIEEMETDIESSQMKNELNAHHQNNILDKGENSAKQNLAALDPDSTNVDVKMKNDRSETTSENVVSNVGKAKDSPQAADSLRNHAEKIDNTKFRSGDNVEKAKESQQNKTEENEKESILGSSFADIDDGIFTDGGTIYPEKCPKGGCWKGYFENVSKRKDRMTSRVQETFHLFFNATPPKGASVTFYDVLEDGNTEENDDESKEGSVAPPQDASKEIPITVVDNKKSEIPEGYLHVRGAGTNIFGTFEILGGFNVETSVLEIQRIYVITNDTIQEVTKQPRERSKSKPKIPSPASERKSYFTRKRPTVLFRYGDSPEPSRSSSAKKRPRGASEHGPSSPLEGIDNDKIKSISVTASGMKENQALTITIADNVPAKISTSRRPSPATPKSSSKSKGTSTQAPVLVTQSSFGAIPKVGNPEDAKWRSAHFLYYHRHADDPETSNNPSQPPRTSYVIYEGDMNEGSCIRDGKGVCLYSNDCIYEGDWRKNKEHGKGTLFSGDRKRKIYEGEWERGKMHGKGTYFYYSFSTIDSSNKLQGEYNGDFKENIRHGIGTYTLEDGSSYEGEWRDNVPSGKGIFRWPDGSKYDGQWKDGRRNGFGKLEASDGFVYDGTWVDNAMEGKGFARYPNGQEYDGMWLNGKRDGRGTVTFGNGAVYKGRFKDDCIEGQGTLKIENNVSISFKKKNQMEAKTHEKGIDNGEISTDLESKDIHEPPPTQEEEDWMIPIEFQSDIGRIHEKAGFTTGGE